MAVATVLWSGPCLEADEPSTTARTASQREPAQSGAISSEEFISSPFADFFKSGEYARALDALDALAEQHPDDPLIIRYRAIVLDRLGRYDEALALYEELLASDPTHVPTRFFRAQTYYEKGDRDNAIKEMQWVVDKSPSKEYRLWAQEYL